jgi:tRNA (mo5U34)-methyltransferase
MSAIDLEIANLGPWFHNLHLPDGTETCPGHPLGDFPRFKWQALARHLPENMEGMTALDIGCNAGFYTLELARRGALVTALDSSEHYLRQARWAAEVCGVADRIEFVHRAVYELGRSEQTWDFVLFLGVLYHLRYPMLGLDIVSRLVRGKLIVQSMLVPGEKVDVPPPDLTLGERETLTRPGWPKLAFLEHRLAQDPSNWWVANHACLEAMLRSSGMRVVARPLEEFYLCEPDRDSASSMWTWNADEYWAAVRRP